MFTLRQLQQFVAIAERGSFRAAAQSLHLSQPALSLAMRQLERVLGQPLLQRDRDAVRPTPQGEVLLSHARALLRDAAEAGEAVRGDARRRSDEVRCGVGPTVSAARLTASMRPVTGDFPGVLFHFTSGVHTQLLPRLRAGELDLLVTLRPAPGPDADTDQEVLLTDRHVVICRAGHPLARRRRVPLARLLDFPWVYSERFERVIPAWGAPFVAAGLEPPEPVQRADSYALVRAIVSTGDSLSVMPLQCCDDDLRSGLVEAVDPGPVPWACHTVLTIRRGRPLPAAAERFRAALRGAFARPPTLPARPRRAPRRGPVATGASS